jgi:hypothetical protein
MEIKIAFCFLTYDKIIRYDIWNEFFLNQNKDKYTVIIHPKNNINNELYTFSNTIIDKRINTTGKDNITIVKATLKLFEEAQKQNATHIIFLSQSCIPLYSFEKLFDFISLIKYSIISCIYNNKTERYNSLSFFLRKYINKNNFVKQQPNMILIKDDIDLILKINLTNHFTLMECPDEHYFINLFINILKRKIIKKQTHFCNYDINKTQALEFNFLDKNFINILREKEFLFIRKIKENSIVDVKYILNN